MRTQIHRMETIRASRGIDFFCVLFVSHSMYSLTCVYPMGECWERRYGAYGVCEVQRLTRLIRPEGLHTADRLVGSACISRLYDESRAAWGDRLSSARRIHRLAISQCSRARVRVHAAVTHSSASLSLSCPPAIRVHKHKTCGSCSLFSVHCCAQVNELRVSLRLRRAQRLRLERSAPRGISPLISDPERQPSIQRSALTAWPVHRLLATSRSIESTAAQRYSHSFGTCSRTRTQRNASTPLWAHRASVWVSQLATRDQCTRTRYR